MSTSALPPQPAAASKAALDAAIKENEASSSSQQNADSANAASTAEASNGADADDSLADESVRTVFDDKEDFNVKHPLFNVWTLWFDNPSHKAVSASEST